MGHFYRLLSIALSVSLMLTPYNTLHAHIENDHHQAVTVHGGHVHDGGAAVDIDDFDHVVDFHFVVVKPVMAEAAVTDWHVAAYEFDLPQSGLPYSTALLRPPSKTPSFVRTHYWQPPPRGPPLNSIAAR